MPACPTCGEDNPERARFCWSCGAAIAEAPRSGAEERKIVSVLFVDLVGFTAASEKADPEDVRARLRPYHARVKQEIERFGGTVEKFVGDAVMAVFGAPVSREDDAERAVNSALRILEAIVEARARTKDRCVSGVAASVTSSRAWTPRRRWPRWTRCSEISPRPPAPRSSSPAEHAGRGSIRRERRRVSRGLRASRSRRGRAE